MGVKRFVKEWRNLNEERAAAIDRSQSTTKQQHTSSAGDTKSNATPSAADETSLHPTFSLREWLGPSDPLTLHVIQHDSTAPFNEFFTLPQNTAADALKSGEPLSADSELIAKDVAAAAQLVKWFYILTIHAPLPWDVNSQSPLRGRTAINILMEITAQWPLTPPRLMCLDRLYHPCVGRDGTLYDIREISDCGKWWSPVRMIESVGRIIWNRLAYSAIDSNFERPYESPASIRFRDLKLRTNLCSTRWDEERYKSGAFEAEMMDGDTQHSLSWWFGYSPNDTPRYRFCLNCANRRVHRWMLSPTQYPPPAPTPANTNKKAKQISSDWIIANRWNTKFCPPAQFVRWAPNTHRFFSADWKKRVWTVLVIARSRNSAAAAAAATAAGGDQKSVSAFRYPTARLCRLTNDLLFAILAFAVEQ